MVKLITNGVVSGLSDFEAYDYDSSRRKQVKEYFKNNDFQSFLGLLNIATYLKRKLTILPKNESKKNIKIDYIIDDRQNYGEFLF